MKRARARIILDVEFDLPDDESVAEATARVAGQYSIDDELTVKECNVYVSEAAPQLIDSMPDITQFYREIIDRLPPKREKWQDGQSDV